MRRQLVMTKACSEKIFSRPNPSLSDMATKTTTAMGQTSSPREEDTPPMTVDTIRPVMDSFFRWIEPRQWARLLSGNPDDETRFMLAELLTDIMALFTKSMLAEVSRRGVKPWEDLLTSLEDALPRALSQALDVPHEVCRETSNSLRSIMFREIGATCVNSIYRSIYPVTPYRPIAILTLDEMVASTIKMLQKCTEKKKLLRCTLKEKPAPVYLTSRTEGFFKKPLRTASPPAPEQTPDATEVTPVDIFVPLDTTMEEVFVSSIAENLISRALKKSKRTCAAETLDAMHQRLYNKLWAEVERQGYNINLDKLKDVDKAIFKDIYKRLHGPKSAMWIPMIYRGPQMEDIIVSCFKKQLKRLSEERGIIAAIGRTFNNLTVGPTVPVF
ncbi:uncharacterized protein LOC124996865 [Mugil cephalus]|uniref:uncharacterized protein LOC124996865 n=1 Tax=Mugil cephalus TaxID=48193 RepID=UPI001FB8232C|nr:uncharacterized protein LOC124996865 [Mugil cephalus]